MILIPIFMPQSEVGFSVYSPEKEMEIAARRKTVLQVLSENNGLTMQEIAVKTNQNIRTTEAILTVLKRYGKIESIYTEQKRLWRIVQ